jgi:hypothetical protein
MVEQPIVDFTSLLSEKLPPLSPSCCQDVLQKSSYIEYPYDKQMSMWTTLESEEMLSNQCGPRTGTQVSSSSFKEEASSGAQ